MVFVLIINVFHSNCDSLSATVFGWSVLVCKYYETFMESTMVSGRLLGLFKTSKKIFPTQGVCLSAV